MANSSGTWVGKDGKTYDTLIDKRLADHAWDKQRQEQADQKRLLVEQNNLLQNQAREQREFMKKQEEMERQRQEFEKDAEEDRQRHEEEMRRKALFDNIGISYNLYREFISSLYQSTITRERMNQIEKRLNEIDTEYEKIDNLMEKDELGTFHFTASSECAKMVEVLGLVTSKEKRLNAWSNFLSFVTIGVFLLFIASFFMHTKFLFKVFLLFLDFVLLCLVGVMSDKLKEELLARNNCKNYALSEAKKKDLEKKKKILEKEENDLRKEADKIGEDAFQKNLEEFYIFRLNHYNAKVEKVLYDVKDNLNIKMIDKTMAKKKGTIDDYVSYFNFHLH